VTQRTRTFYRLEKKIAEAWDVVMERPDLPRLVRAMAALRALHSERRYRIVLVSMLTNEIFMEGDR
jgi:hypothetical protein